MTPSTLRLLDALLYSGPEGGHRESLMRQAELSPATFYRGLEPLLEMGVVVERRGHYTLPLSHPHNFAYKLWHDQSRILELPQRLRVELLSLIDKIHGGLGDNLLALWVHGSAAHQTMGDSSDIDLLAVCSRDQDFDVTGWREVQLTVMTVDNFREDYRHGDNFLRTVFHFGLLVFDRGFSQEFYGQPFPAPVAGYRQEILERIKSRFLFFYREQALEEARKALSSLAVMVGRSLLEPFGILSAGKPQLLHNLELFLGPELTESFRRALAQDKTNLNLEALLKVQWALLDLLQRFDKHVSYLQGVFAGLAGSSQEFDAACYEMFSSIYNAKEHKSKSDVGIDIVVQTAEGEKAISFKSTVGAFTKAQLAHLPAHRPLTLVLNSFREISFERRPEIPTVLKEIARLQGVLLMDSRALWSKFIVKTLVRAYYWHDASALEVPIDDLASFARENQLEWVAGLQDPPKARAGYGELLEVQYGSQLKPGYYRFLAPAVLTSSSALRPTEKEETRQ